MKMKKTAALLLIALLLLFLPACSADPAPESGGESGETVETAPPPESSPMPEEFQYSPSVLLELEGEPVYEDGVFRLAFTDHELSFSDDAVCSVGLISDAAAYSIPAEVVPDGIATDWTVPRQSVILRVSEPIPAGTYVVSVSFGRYVVNFEFSHVSDAAEVDGQHRQVGGCAYCRGAHYRSVAADDDRAVVFAVGGSESFIRRDLRAVIAQAFGHGSGDAAVRILLRIVDQ